MTNELFESLVDKLVAGMPVEAACAAVLMQAQMEQLFGNPGVSYFVTPTAVPAPQIPTAACLRKHLPTANRPSRSEIEAAILACLAEGRG